MRFDNQDGSTLALAAVAALAGAAAVGGRRGSTMRVEVFDDEGNSHTYGEGDPVVHVANPAEWSWLAGERRRLNIGANLIEIQLGSHAATHIAVWGRSLEDALEGAAEYAAEREWAGLVVPVGDVWAQAQRELDDFEPIGDFTDEEEARFWEYVDGNYHNTESGYIPRSGWHYREITDPVQWLEVLYASIQADPEMGSDEELGMAIAAGLHSGNAELAKRYGELMTQLPPPVRVQVDAAMQRQAKRRGRQQWKRR